MSEQDDAEFFKKPLVAQDHDIPNEEYEQKVKQPIDLGMIRQKLEMPLDKPSAYENVSGFSKDVNRIFSNVLKVWNPGQPIADAARRLQGWWVNEWTNAVPLLMTMKAHDNAQTSPAHNEAGEDSAEVILDSNDRGDNFQEQIGMPDEENMRSWSHHHTTDTVDDPVFRAAMRGCDAVSFVFGLEVTWSLIQQRQQEEEERQAMMELEEVRKYNPSMNEEDDSSEEQDNTRDEEKSVTDETEFESIPTGNEAEGSECSKPESPTDSPSTESELCDSLDKDTGDSRPGGHANEEESGEASSSLEDAGEDMDEGPGIGVSAGEERYFQMPTAEDVSSQSPSDKWVCQKCTFLNTFSRKACEMCKASNEEAPSGKWVCLTCTFHNAPSRKTCEVCKTKRAQISKKPRVAE
jgi:hypothetical protein